MTSFRERLKSAPRACAALALRVLLLAWMVQVCFAVAASATALQITNVSTTNLDQSNGTVDIEFDITWNDSWRLSTGPVNWDAAWVFIKFKRNNGDWQRLITGLRTYSAQWK